MAAPLPYRDTSNSQVYTPSFPPPIYYRDTFGLEPMDEYMPNLEENGGTYNAESDEESGTTKSTVRNQIHIYHPNSSMPGPTINKFFPYYQPRRNTGFSATSNQATGHDSQHSEQSAIQSMQMEELLLTNQVLLIFHLPHLMWLTVILFGVALQLVIFSVVSLFFDAHWFGISISCLLLINSILLLSFVRYKHTRLMMWISLCSLTISVLLSFILFALAAYHLHIEDLRIRRGFDEQESNKILQNARITMYSLILVYSPINAVCTCAALYLLLRNMHENRKGQVRKGFFLSRSAGHQKVLVPIKLNLAEEDMNNASMQAD